MFTYRELEVWQRGMDLLVLLYRVTGKFPASEQYGLTSQIRRAVVSIPANVAEGCCRHSTRVFLHHVDIAIGSQGELETCIEAAHRLAFLSAHEEASLRDNLAIVGRLLHGLHRSLSAKLQSVSS